MDFIKKQDRPPPEWREVSRNTFGAYVCGGVKCVDVLWWRVGRGSAAGWFCFWVFDIFFGGDGARGLIALGYVADGRAP